VLDNARRELGIAREGKPSINFICGTQVSQAAAFLHFPDKHIARICIH